MPSVRDLIVPGDPCQSLKNIVNTGDFREPVAQAICTVLIAFLESGGGGGSQAPAGIPEAPTDGNLYGRENAAWNPALPLTGGTVTGNLTVQNPATPPPTGVTDILTITDGTAPNTGQIGIGDYGALTLSHPNGVNIVGGGNAALRIETGPGVYINTPGSGLNLEGAPGGGSIGIRANAAPNGNLEMVNMAQVVIMPQGTGSIALHVDSTTGDLIITQPSGPNAGKSVNLTTGKWA